MNAVTRILLQLYLLTFGIWLMFASDTVKGFERHAPRPLCIAVRAYFLIPLVPWITATEGPGAVAELVFNEWYET